MTDEYKDILTIEKIKFDYKKGFFAQTVVPLVIILVLSPIFYGIVYEYLHGEKNILYTILFLFFGFTLALLIFVLLAACFEAIKDYYRIPKGNFTIVIEELVEKKSEIVRQYNNSRPHTLVFSSNREYYITKADNYPSSKNYRMYKDSVSNSSNIGDKFYLVQNKKNEIILAYNTKFFNLQHNTSDGSAS
jgi:hypothetical protein